MIFLDSSNSCMFLSHEVDSNNDAPPLTPPPPPLCHSLSPPSGPHQTVSLKTSIHCFHPRRRTLNVWLQPLMCRTAVGSRPDMGLIYFVFMTGTRGEAPPPLPACSLVCVTGYKFNCSCVCEMSTCGGYEWESNP